MMRPFWYECLKGVQSPILGVLIAVFCAFNLFMIFSERHVFEQQQVAVAWSEALDEQVVSTEMASRWQDRIDRLREGYNLALQDKGQEPVVRASDFFLSPLYRSGEADKITIRQWTEIAEAEQYAIAFTGIDAYYEALNVQDIADRGIAMYGLEGAAEQWVQKQYERLEDRLQDIVASDEPNGLFYDGMRYEMHSKLFKNMYRILIFELLVLTILATALIMHYEQEQRTASIVYSTRVGRRLQRTKILASLTLVSGYMLMLGGVTLVTFLAVYDYPAFWNSSISSYFNNERNFIAISWLPLTIWQYVLVTAGLLLVCLWLMSLLTTVMQSFIGNSYMTATGVMLFGGLCLWFGNVLPRDAVALMYSSFTPFHLFMNPQVWLMHGGVFATHPYHETGTVIVWSLVLLLAVWIVLRRFKQKAL